MQNKLFGLHKGFLVKVI